MASVKIVLDTKEILEDFRGYIQNPTATLEDLKTEEGNYYLISVARCLKYFEHEFEVTP
jgi:hypothetical protein